MKTTLTLDLSKLNENQLAALVVLVRLAGDKTSIKRAEQALYDLAGTADGMHLAAMASNLSELQ